MRAAKESFSSNLLPAPVVGLCCAELVDPSKLHGAWSAWHRHVLANAAPREHSYMQALFCGRFPSAELAEATPDRLAKLDTSGATIVLLFPDAIGLGFRAIEARLPGALRAGRLFALNGRNRLLKLDPRTLRRLRIRRSLEWSRLPEWLFLAGFIIVTPLLLLADVMGRRR